MRLVHQPSAGVRSGPKILGAKALTYRPLEKDQETRVPSAPERTDPTAGGPSRHALQPAMPAAAEEQTPNDRTISPLL